VPTNSRSDGPRRLRWALAIGAVAFAVVATLNAGGYRFGVSDQAFYVPAILHHLDPALFPRDWPMLGAQGRFFLVDELFAALVRRTGLTVSTWFAIAQLATLAVLYAGGLALGRTMLASSWGLTAWMAALTLRHRIAKTGANTLESYFHPRMLVFGLGLLSLSMYLRGRPWWALAVAAAAGVFHPTTAALFVGLLAVAIVVSQPRARLPLAGFGAAAIGALVVAVASGALDVSTMGDEWLALVGTKDYVFPTRWSLDTWAVNLLGPIVLAAIVTRRRAMGHASAREIGLVVGCLALVAGFLGSLPFIARGVALAVQLQTSRVFWPVEIVATLFLVWWMVERPLAAGGRPALQARIMAATLIALSVGRGLYVGLFETPTRATLAVTLPDDDWTRALAWIRTSTPKDAFVLADPGHAWKPGMGTAVRIAAQRDVFLEETKDVAMALYSRETANRVAKRIADAAVVPTADAPTLRALGTAQGLTVLAIDRVLDLPLLFSSGAIRVYALPGAASRLP
jgi:hypothetical protein